MPLPLSDVRHTKTPDDRRNASSALGGLPTCIGCEGVEPGGLFSFPSPTITRSPYRRGADISGFTTWLFQRMCPLRASTASSCPALFPSKTVLPSNVGLDE